MKIFEDKGKINFVDENNVFVGFDYGQDCCESFGYFFSKNIPKSCHDGNIEDLEARDYVFDTNKIFNSTIMSNETDAGDSVTFRLKNKDDGEIFLTLYNCHNGYYSHGFELNVGGTIVLDGSL